MTSRIRVALPLLTLLVGTQAFAGNVVLAPMLVPVPASVAGVERPVISLNGTWKMAVEPPGEVWRNDADLMAWRDVQVPGGFSELPRTHLAYKVEVDVPADFAGKRTLLRFDGVSGRARLWINGTFVREHWGGFTAWTADITQHVKPGQKAWLTLMVDDRAEGLAKSVRGGGIQRDVRLIAAPLNHLTKLHVSTDLDATYTNATLDVSLAMDFGETLDSKVDLKLKDATGREVHLEPNHVVLKAGQAQRVISIPVAAPAKWDAEHPNLYRLEATVTRNGVPVQTIARNVGFREIERVGQRVLINGKEIKLRGLWDGADVARLRAANINHTRQKWVTEAFLDDADRLGLYVLDEVPIDFAANGAQDDPDQLDEYLSLTADLIERDRSHPSVIMWGTGNESWFGDNVRQTLNYARKADPDRLSFFSWGVRAPAGDPAPFTLFSAHYAHWDDPLGKPQIRFADEIPVLHDEYAHIPWYNRDTMRGDPNVHNFWGESIARFWKNIFNTPGALGGDIFAFRYFDDRGEEKPEYWHMKKAYSPVRVAETPLPNPGVGKNLSIPVSNWFDHTNLSELRVEWAVGDERGTVRLPEVPPHGAGLLNLPPRTWRDGEIVHLNFYARDLQPIDTYALTIGGTKPPLTGFSGLAPRVEQSSDLLTVSGKDFSVAFSRKTGLIVNGAYRGTQVIKDGPYLHLKGARFGGWTLQSLSHEILDDRVVVTIRGGLLPIDVTYRVSIDGSGLIVINYLFNPQPAMVPPMVQDTQIRSVGGYHEIGVSMLLADGVDRLQWERDGLWSVYPDDHIGRNSGTALRVAAKGRRWADEDRDENLFGRYDIGGRGTRDFRSLKEYIRSASAIMSQSGAALRAESDGQDAVRLEVVPSPSTVIDDADTRLRYSGQWERLWAQPGQNEGTMSVGGDVGSAVEFDFEGEGIAWYGAPLRTSGQAGAEDAGLGRTGQISGKADVYLDGKLEIADLDLSRPVERRYSDAWPLALFSKKGLTPGTHRMRIVVKAPGVPIDSLQIVRRESPGDVRMLINNQWNYPDLSWGNYVKRPQITGTFYQNAVRLRLTGAKQ